MPIDFSLLQAPKATGGVVAQLPIVPSNANTGIAGLMSGLQQGQQLQLGQQQQQLNQQSINANNKAAQIQSYIQQGMQISPEEGLKRMGQFDMKNATDIKKTMQDIQKGTLEMGKITAETGKTNAETDLVKAQTGAVPSTIAKNNADATKANADAYSATQSGNKAGIESADQFLVGVADAHHQADTAYQQTMAQTKDPKQAQAAAQQVLDIGLGAFPKAKIEAANIPTTYSQNNTTAMSLAAGPAHDRLLAKQDAASPLNQALSKTDAKIAGDAFTSRQTIQHLRVDAQDAKAKLADIPDASLGPIVSAIKANGLNTNVQELDKLTSEMPFLNKSLVGISQGMRFTQGELDQLNKITGSKNMNKAALQWVMDRTIARSVEEEHKQWQTEANVRKGVPAKFNQWVQNNPEPPKKLDDPTNVYLHPGILKGNSANKSAPQSAQPSLQDIQAEMQRRGLLK